MTWAGCHRFTVLPFNDTEHKDFVPRKHERHGERQTNLNVVDNIGIAVCTSDLQVCFIHELVLIIPQFIQNNLQGAICHQDHRTCAQAVEQEIAVSVIKEQHTIAVRDAQPKKMVILRPVNETIQIWLIWT